MQRFGNVSEEIKRVRKQMEEDEQLSSLMRGLRGQNLRDSQFADENIQLRLVEVCFDISACLCMVEFYMNHSKWKMMYVIIF